MYEKIVFIDDEKDIGALFRILFSKNPNIEFIFFDSPKNAISYLKEQKEKEKIFVLTDINMPELNGLDLLKIIKEMSINIGVMSAYSDSKNKEIATEYGSSIYFEKPVKLNKIISFIEEKKDLKC